MTPILVVFSLLFFSGCAPLRTDVDCMLPPSSEGNAKEEIKDSQQIDVYSPPELNFDRTLSLSDILATSLQFQLKSTRALAAARSLGYSYKSSQSQYYPKLQAEVLPLVDDVHIDPPDSTPPIFFGNATTTGTFGSITERLTLSYLLVDFGGRDAAVDSAWHEFQSSGYLYNQSVQTVLIDTLQAYFNYINALESLEAARENLNTASNSYAIAKGLFEAKYATILDLEQLEVSLLQNEITVRGFEGAVKVEHGALANAMGIKTSIPFEVEDLRLENFPEQLAENVEELMHAALVLRPSLASYREEYLSRRSEIQVARSAGLPKLFLEGSTAHTHFYNGPTNAIDESILSLNLTIPIFEGFFFINQVRKSWANSEYALADWRINEEAVMLDVWSNYYHFLTAKDNLENAKKLIKASSVAYDAAVDLYRMKYASTQDLLNAQSDLANAKLLLIQTKINMAISLSSLAYAIGILTPHNFACKNG